MENCRAADDDDDDLSTDWPTDRPIYLSIYSSCWFSFFFPRPSAPPDNPIHKKQFTGLDRLSDQRPGSWAWPWGVPGTKWERRKKKQCMTEEDRIEIESSKTKKNSWYPGTIFPVDDQVLARESWWSSWSLKRRGSCIVVSWLVSLSNKWTFVRLIVFA